MMLDADDTQPWDRPDDETDYLEQRTVCGNCQQWKYAGRCMNDCQQRVFDPECPARRTVNAPPYIGESDLANLAAAIVWLDNYRVAEGPFPLCVWQILFNATAHLDKQLNVALGR